MQIPVSKTEKSGIKANAKPSFPIVTRLKLRNIIADKIPKSPPVKDMITPSKRMSEASEDF